jgi:hypothetical protein
MNLLERAPEPSLVAERLSHSVIATRCQRRLISQSRFVRNSVADVVAQFWLNILALLRFGARRGFGFSRI